MNRLETARRYSLFLARNLDSGKLKPEIFLPMLDKVLTEADFQAFADWDKIRTEENEEELARQLRELRRYVVSQIIVRDINRISDLNEVTRTITLFADLPSIPRWTLPTPIIGTCTARRSGVIPNRHNI